MDERYVKLSRLASADGMVLLQNQENILPFQKDLRLSIFGRCQFDYYKSGTGSGGAVNVTYQVNAVEGLRNNGSLLLNESLIRHYQSWIAENPFDDGDGGWAAEPWFQKEMPLTKEVVLDAKTHSDVALVIIGRTAGEDQDNAEAEGSYYLTKAEIEMLTQVTHYFDKVVVALNVSNIIDMSWLSNYPQIKAVLYAWHGGMEGGNALADVLTGTVVPSGKLTDTIAKAIACYPSTRQFGNAEKNYYQEDVYVGYRYFETFAREDVLFPFGFGLSYTTFSIDTLTSEVQGTGSEKKLTVSCRVVNTGKTHGGQEVVQLYYSPPQGALGKPARNLGTFAKTRVLAPGEAQVLTLNIPFSSMASYDDSGATGHKSAFVLEAGDYRFFVGNSSQALEQITVDGHAFYPMHETLVVEQLEEALSPQETFERFKPGALQDDGNHVLTFETVPTRSYDLKARMTDRMPLETPLTGDQGLKLKDVKEGKATLAAFVAQLSPAELCTLVKGEGMSSPKVTSGTAAAFGGVSEALLGYGIPIAAAADGPSGIRRDSGHKAFQVGIGTLLACTWDTALVEALFEHMGDELIEYKIDTLLGPGINIHRHPLNGRNFEYFSEDPLITGQFALAVTKALRKKGVYTTLKHFAANDQEKARHVVDAIASERALREIHLKGFEIAVKEGDARSIMTAYNPINGIYAASNYDLNTTILRAQWGYKGIVMTDWWAKMNHPVNGGIGHNTVKGYMVMAQNDLFMVVGHDEATDFSVDLLMDFVERGELIVGELQRCAQNICQFLMEAPCLENQKDHYTVKNIVPMDTLSIPVSLTDTLDYTEDITASTQLGVEIQQDGVFGLWVRIRYTSHQMAQTACNFSINDVYIATAQLHGSQSAWKETQLFKTALKKGYYVLDLDFIKPGIEINAIKLIPIQ